MSTIRLATGATVESPSTDHLLAVAQREIDRLAVGERALDEARAELARERADRDRIGKRWEDLCSRNDDEYRSVSDRLAQAVALLREARTYIAKNTTPTAVEAAHGSIVQAIDAFLAGQPAPVYQAMARVCEAARDMRDLYAYDISEAMKNALADLERARKGGG